MINQYDIGNLIALTGVFTTISGTPIDPTTITLTIRQPNNVLLTYTYASSQLTRNGIGNYSYNFQPTQPGLHTYRFAGTGACMAAGDTNFLVLSSLATPP